MGEEGIKLGEIVKSETDKIVVSVNAYKGHRYVDVRTYFQGDDGNYLPTKKGVTFSPKFIEAMIKILKKGLVKI